MGITTVCHMSAERMRALASCPCIRDNDDRNSGETYKSVLRECGMSHEPVGNRSTTAVFHIVLYFITTYYQNFYCSVRTNVFALGRGRVVRFRNRGNSTGVSQITHPTGTSKRLS